MSDIPSGEAITVIRSEERLAASTTAIPVRRAVLRKVIVSEERTITVTVRHEEFRLDYAPIEETSFDAAPLTAPLELVLHEEQIHVSTTVVPVERVTVSVRQAVEERAVTGAVHLEQVDLDGVPHPADGDLVQPRLRG